MNEAREERWRAAAAENPTDHIPGKQTQEKPRSRAREIGACRRRRRAIAKKNFLRRAPMPAAHAPVNRARVTSERSPGEALARGRRSRQASQENRQTHPGRASSGARNIGACRRRRRAIAKKISIRRSPMPAAHAPVNRARVTSERSPGEALARGRRSRRVGRKSLERGSQHPRAGGADERKKNPYTFPDAGSTPANTTQDGVRRQQKIRPHIPGKQPRARSKSARAGGADEQSQKKISYDVPRCRQHTRPSTERACRSNEAPGGALARGRRSRRTSQENRQTHPGRASAGLAKSARAGGADEQSQKKISYDVPRCRQHTRPSTERARRSNEARERRWRAAAENPTDHMPANIPRKNPKAGLAGTAPAGGADGLSRKKLLSDVHRCRSHEHPSAEHA